MKQALRTIAVMAAYFLLTLIYETEESSTVRILHTVNTDLCSSTSLKQTIKNQSNACANVLGKLFFWEI